MGQQQQLPSTPAGLASPMTPDEASVAENFGVQAVALMRIGRWRPSIAADLGGGGGGIVEDDGGGFSGAGEGGVAARASTAAVLVRGLTDRFPSHELDESSRHSARTARATNARLAVPSALRSGTRPAMLDGVLHFA